MFLSCPKLKPNVPFFLKFEKCRSKTQFCQSEFVQNLKREKLIQIETNLDDLQPQIISFTQQRLLQEGALDVWVTPTVMKKSRAACQLAVLCTPQSQDEIIEIVFRETSTLGIRVFECERLSLEREFHKITTQYGDVNVKVGKCGDEIVNVHPEFEECAQLAEQEGIPIKAIIEEAIYVYKSQYV
eukprot:TRINITY_DN12117_c0_g1_i1.p2 TRINITY_DN12117_c0_g1~~TRINITY_DN12117_c0_g1_i1.p2  ORF type:complete len:185 (+),score=20.84 TRINITY_DN12117_c0_g1_i1:102-656(+)